MLWAFAREAKYYKCFFLSILDPKGQNTFLQIRHFVSFLCLAPRFEEVKQKVNLFDKCFTQKQMHQQSLLQWRAIYTVLKVKMVHFRRWKVLTHDRCQYRKPRKIVNLKFQQKIQISFLLYKAQKAILWSHSTCPSTRKMQQSKYKAENIYQQA